MADSIVGVLRVLLTSNSSEFEAAMKKAADSAKVLSNDMKTVGTSLSTVGASLTKAITLPLVAIGAAAIKSGVEFEGVMNSITGVLRPTERQMESVRATAIKMGADTAFSATDAATAILELGKAGFTTEKAVSSVGDVLQLAAASGLSMGEAAEMAARTLNAFGMESTDLAHVNDVLAKAVNTSSLEITDLQTAFGYIGPIATSFGISIEQASAALGIMRDAGIAAETSGRALREGLSRLANPVRSVKEVMAELGISSFETNGKLMGLADIVAVLEGKNITAAQSLKLFGDAAGPGMFALISKGRPALDSLTEGLKNSEGAAKNMADAMMKGLPGAFEKMRGSIETALLSISKAIEPAVMMISSVIEKTADIITTVLVPAFTSLPVPVQSAALAFLGVSAAIGPVLWGFGQLITGAGQIMRTFGVDGIATRALVAFRTQAVLATGATTALGAAASVAAGAGLIVALGLAVAEVAKAMGRLYDVWKSGGSMWAFFSARDDDNFLRRWLGLSQAIENTGAAMKPLASHTQQASDGLKMMASHGVAVAPAMDRAKVSIDDLVKAENEQIDVQEQMARWFAESTKKAQEQTDALHKVNLMLLEGVSTWDDYGAELEKTTKRIGSAIIANALTRKTYEDELDTLVRERTQSRVEFELGQIARWAANEKNALDTSVSNWREAADAIEAIAAERSRVIIEQDELAQRVIFANLDTVAKKTQDVASEIKTGVLGIIGSIPATLSRAFEGGGSLTGAFVSIGAQLADEIATPIIKRLGQMQQAAVAAGAGIAGALGGATGGGTIGTIAGIAGGLGGAALAASTWGTSMAAAGVAGTLALGAATLGIGAAAVGVAILIRHFASVSKEIKEARVKVAEFQQSLVATATATQLNEAAMSGWGDRGALTLIRVRDALIAIGRSGSEADALVKALWDTDHPDRARAAMEQINIVLAAQKDLLEKNRAEASGLFDDLMAAAGEARGQLPDALQPMIDKMVELGLLTADQAAQFDALSGDAEVDFEQMQDDAEKYGIALGDLGPQFRGAKLSDTAGELWRVFDGLTRQGASVGGVLFGMRDEMSQFVADSVRAGRDIPENFRPLIEELQRSGNLFDENRLKAMAWGEETLEKGREIPEGLRGVIRTFIETGDLIDAASGKTLTLDDLMTTYGRDGSDAVRDVIAQLGEQDTKIGDNNGALTDLSELNFGDPIVRAIDSIVTRFEEFLTRISTAETRLSHGVPASARTAAGGLEDMSRRGIDAMEDLGAAIRNNVIEMHSPTGLEGIAVYAGLAADAMSNMARTGGAAMRSVSSAVAGVATAMNRIGTSNIGKQLAGVMGNMRGLDMQDFGGLLSGFKGMGDKLVDKFHSLFREVRIGMAEGFSKELQTLQFRMQDEVNALGPDPATYRANWGLARETLQQQLRYQLEDLEEARRDQILSLGPLPDAYEQYYNKAIGKAEKAYQKQLRSLEESKRRELANLDDVVEYYGGSYEEAERAVRDEHAAMLQDAIERYEEEIEQLGPIPSEYAQIYEKAFDQVNVYYDRMEARAEEKSQRELELLGPIPDEYETLFGQALELVKSKYKSMVEEAAKAAKETVDAWKIVGEMFSTLTAANPNLAPSGAPTPSPAPPAYGVTSGGWVVSQGEAESQAAPPMYGVTSGGWIVSQGGIPHLAMGGIVSVPTLAMIGEGGPEAVVPLDRLNGGHDLATEFRQFRSEAATDRALAARDRAQLPHLIGVAVNARVRAGRR